MIMDLNIPFIYKLSSISIIMNQYDENLGESAHGRSKTVSVLKSICDRCHGLNIVIELDSSDGEYGGVSICHECIGILLNPDSNGYLGKSIHGRNKTIEIDCIGHCDRCQSLNSNSNIIAEFDTSDGEYGGIGLCQMCIGDLFGKVDALDSFDHELDQVDTLLSNMHF